MHTLEPQVFAPIERNLNNPLCQSLELIPQTFGAREAHIQGMTYGEMLQFAQAAAIGHPYFDARYSYFNKVFVPHFNKMYKLESRARRAVDFEMVERLGLVKPSVLRRFGRWLKKIDRAIYNAGI